MVSTGWRTACTVIVIIVGAAALTFVVHIYRRRKTMRLGMDKPQMQERFMDSFAGDPESHMPLLRPSDGLPPVPPKAENMTHHRSTSSLGASSHQRGISYAGDVSLNAPETKIRAPPGRVPVPPMFPEPELVDVQAASVHSTHPSFPVPDLGSASKSPIFALPNIQFPRIQLKADGKKGRLPSLRIKFVRESNQVVSSPLNDAFRPSPHIPPMSSPSSGPSTLSRPFATMANSPLPDIPRLASMSTIEINRQSASIHSDSSWTNIESPQRADVQSMVSMPEPEREIPSPASVQTVGKNLFSRKLSTEDSSYQTLSRNSSAQVGRPMSDPGFPSRSVSLVSRSGSGSGSGSGSASGSNPNLGSGVGSSSAGAANLRRVSTWVPNVFASYSPWHAVLPLDSPTGQAAVAREQVESPPGHLRVAEAYRPMPTLEETPEVTPATLPMPLPDEECASARAEVGSRPSSPSYLSEDPLPLPPQLAELSATVRVPAPKGVDIDASSQDARPSLQRETLHPADHLDHPVLPSPYDAVPLATQVAEHPGTEGSS